MDELASTGAANSGSDNLHPHCTLFTSTGALNPDTTPEEKREYVNKKLALSGKTTGWLGNELRLAQNASKSDCDKSEKKVNASKLERYLALKGVKEVAVILDKMLAESTAEIEATTVIDDLPIIEDSLIAVTALADTGVGGNTAVEVTEVVITPSTESHCPVLAAEAESPIVPLEKPSIENPQATIEDANSSMLKAEVTFIPNVRQPGVSSVIPLRKVLLDIKKEVYKKPIEKARLALMLGDDDEYKRLKGELPCISFNGTFTGNVTNDNFAASSNLIGLDLDHIEDIVKVKAFLETCLYVVYCFRSPSNHGLKTAFRLAPGVVTDDASFKLAFKSVEDFLSQNGLAADISCKDVRRVCFVSSDPELFYNKRSVPFPITEVIPEKKKKLPEATLDYTPIEIDGICPDINASNAAKYLPPAGEQSYSEWRDVGAILHYQFGGSDEGLDIFDTWSQSVREYKGYDDVAKQWSAFKRTNGKVLSFKTLIKQYHERMASSIAAADTLAPDIAKKLLSECSDPHILVRDIAPKLLSLANKNAFLESEFMDELIKRFADLCPEKTLTKTAAKRAMKMRRNTGTIAFKRIENGMIMASLGNVVRAICEPGFLGVHIGLDEFREEIMLHYGDGQWQAFGDEHYTELRIHLGKHDFLEVPRELIRDAVYAAAVKNKFDSAQLWLQSRGWDGISRVERFFPDYFGTEDTPYTRAVSRYLWTAMVGRILSPGCQVDMVPILQGEQGMLKSTSIAAMVPAPEHYCEIDFSDKDDDNSRKMRGLLIGEFGELRGLHTKDQESIKAFITRQREKWTPKFKEFTTTFPRRCVFIGTTNQDKFLADSTGNRRFLPLAVTKADRDAIIRDRDQLWAEGAILFASGGVAWEDAEQLAKNEFEAFEMSEPWEEIIAKWLKLDRIGNLDVKGKPMFSNDEILADCLKIDAKSLNRSHTYKIGVVMRKLGYVFKQVRHKGEKPYFWAKE